MCLAQESVQSLVQDPSPATQAAAELMRSTMTTFTHSVSEALGNGTLLPVEPISEDAAAAELEAERAAARAALQAQLQAFQQVRMACAQRSSAASNICILWLQIGHALQPASSVQEK